MIGEPTRTATSRPPHPRRRPGRAVHPFALWPIPATAPATVSGRCASLSIHRGDQAEPVATLTHTAPPAGLAALVAALLFALGRRCPPSPTDHRAQHVCAQEEWLQFEVHRQVDRSPAAYLAHLQS